MATQTSFLPMARELLVDATRKLIDLRANPKWHQELPQRCPPILWFGNAVSSRPIVLTFGANPSRREYLADTKQRAVERFAATGSDEKLTYLEGAKARFRLLSKDEALEDILREQELQDDIIEGYNRYFKRNPYRWFGQRSANSYNVEGFLRGFGASYFHQNEAYQAAHIDLFPFATLRDFKDLQSIAVCDLINTGWAADLVRNLIELTKAAGIIVFGRTNFEHYKNYIDKNLQVKLSQKYENATYWLSVSGYREVPVIGLSTNLGNPKGFTAQGLKIFGHYIQQGLLEESTV